MAERGRLRELRYGQSHKRRTFTATLARIREYDNSKMLANICADGELVVQHLWVFGRDARQLDYPQGTQVKFTGRIYLYRRVGGTLDYGIRYIREVKKHREK